MPKRIEQNRLLYTGVSVIVLFLAFAATGGGLTGSDTFWMTDWQHHAFSMFCHQDPSRSFWVNGTPMAVCSRCYGIYTGLAVAWLFLPFFISVRKGRQFHAKQLLLAAVCINVLDLIGNIAGFWQNTLVSRFFMGNLIGLTVVVLLASGFIIEKGGEYWSQLETKS